MKNRLKVRLESLAKMDIKTYHILAYLVSDTKRHLRLKYRRDMAVRAEAGRLIKSREA